ncbi:MAG: flagellar biosynthetic protein FliO [Burkholderiales bacterium]|nr:flagellar biosynthetic protein FliO [Burkholderiales bacterium]
MPFSYLTSALWFVAIVAAIPFALWLLKRTPLAGVGGRAGTPRLIAMLPVSNQHKLMTIEVGQGEERLWLVVGVSPQGLRTLHTMAAQPEAEVPTPPAAAFAQLLGRLRNDKGDHAA